MGRASRGGGGGGHSSHSFSGGHSSHSFSSSRSSSSHSFSSGRSSRGTGGFGGGSSSRSSRPSRPAGSFGPGPAPRPPRGPRPRRVYYSGGGYGARPMGCGCSSVLVAIIVLIIVLLIVGMVAFSAAGSGGSSSSDGIPASTYERTPLKGGSFTGDCVTDEIGWIGDSQAARLGSDLRYFWDKTGVQPYIVLLDYDAALTTESAQEAYAQDYFEEEICAENAFLLMYFNDAPGDAGGWGDWQAIKGRQVDSVMDDEAMTILWAYLDRYWYGDYSEAQVFENTFRDTADRIMEKTTTAADVAKVAVIVVLVIVVIVGIVVVMKTRRKHEAERNAETERILNTPLEEAEDPTLEKYMDADVPPADGPDDSDRP